MGGAISKARGKGSETLQRVSGRVGRKGSEVLGPAVIAIGCVRCLKGRVVFILIVGVVIKMLQVLRTLHVRNPRRRNLYTAQQQHDWQVSS